MNTIPPAQYTHIVMEVPCGARVSDLCEKAARLSSAHAGMVVRFEVNGFMLHVCPAMGFDARRAADEYFLASAHRQAVERFAEYEAERAGEQTAAGGAGEKTAIDALIAERDLAVLQVKILTEELTIARRTIEEARLKLTEAVYGPDWQPKRPRVT